MNRPSARLEPDQSLRARFTSAEFQRMAESGAFADMTVELVEGELDRMTPPMNSHSGRQASVMMRLGSIIGESRLRGDLGIDFGNDTILSCDAAALIAPVADHRLLRPDELLLVIEISETTKFRDMGMKRVRYATAAIPHYWVVDGDRSVVHVYGDPIGDDYAEVYTVKFGEPLGVPGTDRTIVID